ncbi:MAG TPA: hypothetical protein GX400_01610 [Chloroflexi bacterium]|nr:hypothetical protein [Chloroflexota bacterium]
MKSNGTITQGTPPAWRRTAPVVLVWLLTLLRAATLVLFLTQRGAAIGWLLRKALTCLTLIVVAILLLGAALLWGLWQWLVV